MEGLARHEVASIINMYLLLGFWEVQGEEVGASRATVNKLPSAPQPRPQELRSDAAPARTGCLDLNLNQPPSRHTLPAQKQMNRLLSRANPLLRSLNRAPLLYRATARMDYSSVPTPERCYADFCLVPVREHGFSSLSPHCCSELSTPWCKEPRNRFQGLTALCRSERASSPWPRRSPRCRSCSRRPG